MSNDTSNLRPVATLDCYRVASATMQARATVRYELTDTAATGQADPGVKVGLMLAHAEAPGTFADVTDADIEALIAGVGK